MKGEEEKVRRKIKQKREREGRKGRRKEQEGEGKGEKERYIWEGGKISGWKNVKPYTTNEQKQ